MELQGKPIGITGSGTKNTSVPAEPIQEGPGAVAKDSLAAESSAVPDQYTSDVTGKASTFNNTDTSGAKTLPPAGSATDRIPAKVRDNTGGISGRKYPEAAGRAEFDGKHSDQGYTGGPASGSTNTTGSGVYHTNGASRGSGVPGGGLKTAGPALTSRSVPLQHTKPKGTNIQEGGFDSTDAPNASFTSEIGTENDPGRKAEYDLQRQSAGDAADSGLPKTQKGLDTEHPYQALRSEETA